MIQVSANLGETSLEAAARRVKAVLRDLSFPSEYYADIGGQYEDLVQAGRDFWLALALALFLVFTVMACQFESLRDPLIIMGTVPLAAIGAVAALALAGSTVTLGVSVGLLMLGGIEVNKGIILIDRMRSLEGSGIANPVRRALRAGTQRMRPIYMTTAAIVLGLAPMAMDRSESAPLWSPLAVTVIGGLLFASVLTLYTLPAVYLVVGNIRSWPWARDLFFFWRGSANASLVTGTPRGD
jgi:HAE1 family hydrophobic/amphiphilic exporter-1